MKNNPLRLRAENQPWRHGVAFVLCADQAVCPPITLTKIDADPAVIEPTFVLENTQAQTLMDDLWACGFRPTEGTGSAGALAATQKHLEDMRRLVFEKEVTGVPIR